tara:strand:+ start:2525 stop:4081 length:1557 start_codon:yes stop_codon:yes gene_type:complete
MKEINRLAAHAKRALDRMQNGKKYTSAYVVNRLEKASFTNSKDQLICNMRDVIRKKASNQKFISQSEIGEIYDHLYGFSSGRSNFRNELGDLLPPKHATLELSQLGAAGSRVPMENELGSMYEETQMADELAGVFSLDKKAFSAHGDNTVSKAEKFVKVQLASMGYSPTAVRAVRTNDHFILCSAAVDTSDHTQVSIPVPVQITNGIPSLPQHFVADNSLIKLNSENLFLFIKDKNNHLKKTARNKYIGQRSVSSFESDRAVVPVALEKYADLEDSLVSAATHFTPAQVTAATNTVALELAGLGVSNPQVKVSGSSSREINVTASIPTGMGRVDIGLSVGMKGGRPALPSTFDVGGSSIKLSRAGINQVIDLAKNDSSINKVSREAEAMLRMSYPQLMNEVSSGVSTKDYKRSEDALGAIETRFGGEKHAHALEAFSRLLKHAGKGSDRDRMIKNALESGDLIWVQTSVEPYCPKLGLPASKIDFDEKGRLIPLRRSLEGNSLDEAGALISSSRIQLS